MSALTAENYVREWVAAGRRNGLVRRPWEDAFQAVGAIQEAANRGYLSISSNAACDITLTPLGEAIAANNIEAVIAAARETQDRFTAYVRSQPVAPMDRKDNHVLAGVKFSATSRGGGKEPPIVAIDVKVPSVRPFASSEYDDAKVAVDALQRAVAFYLTHLEALS